jgi:hypothetical protein
MGGGIMTMLFTFFAFLIKKTKNRFSRMRLEITAVTGIYSNINTSFIFFEPRGSGVLYATSRYWISSIGSIPTRWNIVSSSYLYKRNV